MARPDAVPDIAVDEPAYRFTTPGTLLFVNGAPLSGKSTVAPLVAANIAGCAVQNMDILRAPAQALDRLLPANEREPALQFGSCDGYLAVGDGSYSPGALLEGYRRFSRGTCRLLGGIVSQLEAQNASNVLFEGVQLMPDIVGEYLDGKHQMVIVTTDAENFAAHREIRYGADASAELTERYSTDRLLLIQDEILRQSDALPDRQVYVAENAGSYAQTAASVLGFLASVGAIERAS